MHVSVLSYINAFANCKEPLAGSNAVQLLVGPRRLTFTLRSQMLKQGVVKEEEKFDSMNKSRSDDIRTIGNNVKVALSQRGIKEQKTKNKHAGDSILR